jgi:cbb3-type cytochrome oxidase cytochrome c subunit
MKYYCIQIRPYDDEWHVSYHLDPEDRVRSKTTPSYSVYYCPERKGLKKGFQELKEYMIAEHEERISVLQESLNKLIELELDV